MTAVPLVAKTGIGFGDETLSVYDEGTWVPTITATGGAITSTTLNDARYTKIGRLVLVTVDFTIADKGTGTGDILITVPFTIAKSAAGAAFEQNFTGIGGRVFAAASNNKLNVAKQDGGTILTNGYRLVCSVTYES